MRDSNRGETSPILGQMERDFDARLGRHTLADCPPVPA